MARSGSKRWWTLPKGKRHDAVVRTAKQIETDSGGLFAAFADFVRMYSGVRPDMIGGAGSSGGMMAALSNPGTKRLPRIGYNIIKSVIDTKRAKITATDIRPFAVTDGGNWDQQQRAKKLSKFIEGMFAECEMRTLAPEVYRFSRVVGMGMVKIYEKEKAGRPAVEIVDPFELRVDAADGQHGRPCMLIQVKRMHRDVVREMFDKPVTSEAISGAKDVGTTRGSVGLVDMIDVYEAWHLRSGPDADDGLHVLCTDAGTLLEEEWAEDEFPFEFLRGDRRMFGFWGVGDAEDLAELQKEVQKLLKTVQQSIHLCSVPRYAIPRGANVAPAKMTNDVGALVEYDGAQPPTPLPSPQVPPDLYQQINGIIERAYQLKGVSEAASNSQLPAGLAASGEAQRVYADTQTERFNVEAREYEQFHVRVGRKLIRCARAIHERDGSFKVKTPGKKFLESIDWKHVDLEDDEFDLTILPSSNLPKTLSGRLASVQELMQAGIIDNPKTEGRKLLNFPDLEEDTEVALAAYDDALRTINEILEHGKRPPVDPYQDLAACLDLGRKMWLKARGDGCPQSRLDTLAEWLEEVGAKQQAAMAPPPDAAPPGPPDAGMGQAAAPPTSNLMPVNGAAA